MGLDFIRKSKRDFAKEWARGLHAAAVPDLLDPVFLQHRVIESIEPSAGTNLSVGQLLTVDRCGDEVRVFDGLTPVAKIERPSSDLVALLDKLNGNALAQVERLSIFNDRAEILVQ